MEVDRIKISKFLSLVLRHRPETIGLKLNSNGWANVEQLLMCMEQSGRPVSRSMLEEVVSSNNKQRFSFNEGGSMIRANQGHSIKGIDLGLEPLEPPQLLYHGTVPKNLEGIRRSGIRKKSRQHVHLSSTLDVAINVGKRRGRPIVLVIDSETMYNHGHSFYMSHNGVWLTDVVEWKYVRDVLDHEQLDL